jgi:hypothetical protein
MLPENIAHMYNRLDNYMYNRMYKNYQFTARICCSGPVMLNKRQSDPDCFP